MLERVQFTKEYVEGVGWIVREQKGTKALAPGQSLVQMAPAPPPLLVSIEDVPYDLACQVVRNNGMFVVPLEFLTDAAKESMLEIDTPVLEKKGDVLTEAEVIRQIKAANSLEEITAIIGTDTRKKVIKAAEERAVKLTEV